MKVFVSTETRFNGMEAMPMARYCGGTDLQTVIEVSQDQFRHDGDAESVRYHGDN